MSGGGSSRQGAGVPLFGRDEDIELIHSFVNQAAAGGGALLVSGEIGVGKTVLLEAAAAHAASAGDLPAGERITTPPRSPRATGALRPGPRPERDRRHARTRPDPARVR